MTEMSENIVDMFAMFGIAALLMIGFLIWIMLNNINFKMERKMKRVPIDLQLLKDIKLSLEKHLPKTGKKESSVIAYEMLVNYLEEIEKKNIDNLLKALNEPAQRIVLEFFEIIRDKRISLKDSGPALRIISDTSRIAKNFAELRLEIEDLDYDELDIVMLEISNQVKETKRKLK